MNPTVIIAFQEWRYWFRTRLGAMAALLALLLVCVSVFSSINSLTKEKNTRANLQIKAEHTFKDQPARHPHRMVHYGHYVFRTPAPLAMLDPGVDPYTGTVMFLEGHRQNSATFSPSYGGAHAGPFASLTPAITYQLLVPLVLIVMGFGLLAREREAATAQQLITSGISPLSIWLGKTLALVSVAAILLIPIIIGVLLTESIASAGFGFVSLYAIYLLVWVVIISAISTWSKSTSMSLLSLLVIWTVLCILLPRLIASAATVAIPTPSQIESDMEVIVALRSVGDGHNANDPAFNQLKANLLAKYDVEKLEDLPINFRGLIAQTSEADLTAIMNKYADKRMANQTKQMAFIKSYEAISPFLILQSASMITAGTDGRTHHRFLQEAEAIRFELVQDLNKVHTQKMAYIDDINRNKDPDAAQRTRMSADNWRVLNDFRFKPDSALERLERVNLSWFFLFMWVLVFAFAGVLGARRLAEANHG